MKLKSQGRSQVIGNIKNGMSTEALCTECGKIGGMELPKPLEAHIIVLLVPLVRDGVARLDVCSVNFQYCFALIIVFYTLIFTPWNGDGYYVPLYIRSRSLGCDFICTYS